MKQITLSDHTADKAQQAQKVREDDYAARMSAFRGAMEAKKKSVAEARAMRQAAWRDGRYFAWIGNALRTTWRSSFGWPNEPVMQGATTEERIWTVGGQGEARVAEFLLHKLPDEWTLVSGYRNGRGEIDQILVGPSGLFTIEVKNLNGTVTVQGDEWSADKYDNYGNLVERSRPIKDKGGRSPSRQLNEPTDRMIEFLRRSLPTIDAVRIVALSHEKSAIERVFEPTAIPVVLRSWSLRDTLTTSGSTLSPPERSRIIEQLQRDHAYHQKRRQQRSVHSATQSSVA